MKRSFLNILFWSVISAAFIGPGTVTTAAKAGSGFGLPILWALSFATLACIVLQEAASRLTIVSGMDLGQAIRNGLSPGKGKSILLVPVLVAFCILSGTAAYQAGNLMGAMAGFQLFVSLPAWTLVLLLGILAGLLLMVPSVKLIARTLGGLVALMGLTFLITALSVRPPVGGLISGMFRPYFPQGGSLLILGLVGTTVVPYNLFLGSGISSGQSVREMRTGLVIAISLGGLISMAVLVTGTAIPGEFTFPRLADALNAHIGGMGRVILGAGLMAAGFTSAVTAPLASAVTARSLFGNRNPGEWTDTSLRFRMVWLIILLTGMGFGMAGFRPVPAIILAQALNGIILPVVSVFLLLAVNHRRIMGDACNRLPANVLMGLVVYFSMIIGMTGLSRAVLAVIRPGMPGSDLLLLMAGLLSMLIMIFILIRVRHVRKGI